MRNNHSITDPGKLGVPRLPLVPDITTIFDKLPDLNLFKAAANAVTLYPTYIQHVYQTFQPLELDSKIERLVILYVAKLSACELIWRQNVVTALAMKIPQAEIDALAAGELDPDRFGEAQLAAFHFAEEALRLIEVTDPVYDEAARHFGPRAITELIYIVGTYMFLARIARTGRVPLDTTPADSAKYL